jgi:hypothetical protein
VRPALNFGIQFWRSIGKYQQKQGKSMGKRRDKTIILEKVMKNSWGKSAIFYLWKVTLKLLKSLSG